MYMLVPQVGVDPMDHLEQLEIARPAPHPDGHARVRRLADALRAADARYDENRISDEGRDASRACSAARTASRSPFGPTTPTSTSRTGILLTRRASPTTSRRPRTSSRWRRAGSSDDPQLEKWVDPGADGGEVHRMFDFGREKLSEIIEEGQRGRCAARPQVLLQAAVRGARGAGRSDAPRHRCRDATLFGRERSALAERVRVAGGAVGVHPATRGVVLDLDRAVVVRGALGDLEGDLRMVEACRGRRASCRPGTSASRGRCSCRAS